MALNSTSPQSRHRKSGADQSRVDQARRIRQCEVKKAGSASLDPAYSIIFKIRVKNT